MNKYEVIEKIMQSTKVDKEKKLYYIQSFLMNWLEKDDIKWLWEE